MKRWKLSLLTLSITASIFGITLFSACEVDPCTDLKCKNGSACTEGFCRCPTGYEGAECEYKTATRFLGTFVGLNHCDDLPALTDTVDVVMAAEPNVVDYQLRHANGDRIRGTVDGYSIIVSDVQIDNYLRKSNAVIDGNQIRIYIERGYGPGQKTVCEFVGTRR